MLSDDILHWLRHEATDADYAAKFARATTRDIAAAFNLSNDSAYRVLAKMARQGLIKRAGRVSMHGRFRGLRQSGPGTEPGWQLWELYW